MDSHYIRYIWLHLCSQIYLITFVIFCHILSNIISGNLPNHFEYWNLDISIIQTNADTYQNLLHSIYSPSSHFHIYCIFIVCAVKTKKVWTWNLIVSALNIPYNHAFQLILQGFSARFAKVASHKVGCFSYGLYKVRSAFFGLLFFFVFWHIHKSPLHEKRAYRVISIRLLLIVAVVPLSVWNWQCGFRHIYLWLTVK